MKKGLKIFGITLASLVGLVLIAAAVLVWIVFTPSRLTPIVRDTLNKTLTCQVELESVELTFFSTFPQFGLKIDQLMLLSPMQGAPSDTLASVASCTATLDAMAWYRNNELILHDFILRSGSANLFVDESGKANYAIYQSDTTVVDTTAFELPFANIDLKNLTVEHLTVNYSDMQSKMYAALADLNLSLRADVTPAFDGDAYGKFDLKNMIFATNDSAPLLVQSGAVALSFEGNKKADMVAGQLRATLPDLTLQMDTAKMLRNAALALDAPFSLDLTKTLATLKQASLTLNEHRLHLDGWGEMCDNDDIAMDLRFSSDEWQLKQVLALIPAAYSESLKGLTLDAQTVVSGSVVGIYNEKLMPQITALIDVSRGTMRYTSLPYTFTDIKGQIAADIDMSSDSISRVDINRLSLKTGKSSASVSGSIDDLMGKMFLNLRIKGDIDLVDAAPMLPKDMRLALSGHAKPDLHLRSTLDDLSEVRLKKIRATGSVGLSDFDMLYDDSISIKAPSATVALTLPSPNKNASFDEVVKADITSALCDIEMVGTMNATAKVANLKVGLSDLMNDAIPMSVACDFDINRLNVAMDTITADVKRPRGSFSMTPSKKNTSNTVYLINLAADALDAAMGRDMNLTSQALTLKGNATYDEKAKDLLAQWLPNVDLNFNSGVVNMASLGTDVRIPTIDLHFSPENITINKSRIVLKNSDFNLSGTLTNLDKFMDDSGLLEGDLDFVSNYTDVNELMDLASGFGASDSTQKAALAEKPESGDSEPFMVPWGMDVTLRTKVKKALAGNTIIENIGGTLIVRDGVMVLEQMGFTCDAAKMQLTAVYRSPRKNHLFAGIDFHLLDIEVDKLIDMIPDIDTIVPMLKYFNGKGEFHLAANTNLKSNYDIKWSTLIGAAAIEGKDLVLIDNDTFSKISKLLLFKKKTKNRVDSMSVEMTVFRNEVDLYPFLFAMDKYQVIIGGRYDLNGNYAAHVEAIVPLRLAVDVKGDPASDLKFKLVKTKYANLFKPEKQNALQQRTLALKKLIADALKANVKEQPDAVREITKDE